jgi:hypothetical protein
MAFLAVVMGLKIRDLSRRGNGRAEDPGNR